MATANNTIVITDGFYLAAKKPVDLKYIAETIEERNTYSENNVAYEGMLVYVKENKQTYQFINDNWIEFGLAGFEFSSEIENSLTSDSITKALSANQGNILNSSINAHKANMDMHISKAERNTWNAKASTKVATVTDNGLMSATDKDKLDKIDKNANNYVHPMSHPASIIVTDSDHRFVTDEEITKWNSEIGLATEIKSGLMSASDKVKLNSIEKESLNVVTTTTNGLMSASDKVKLNGIAENANNYIHPNNEGMRHVTDADIKRWDGKADKNIATEDVKGLMSVEDKVKLNSIAENANNYIHPDTHPASMIISDSTHNFVTEEQIDFWNAKASTKTATEFSNGLLSMIDKSKLNGIENNANNYIHPDTHPANIIVEDSTHRFVSDEEKEYWNNKASTQVSTTESNGLMSKEDKIKLDGIENNANNYIHPDTHSANIIVEDSTHRFVSDEEKEYWNNKASKDIATNSENGLMSANDKIKLDGIENNANNYVHPETHFGDIIVTDSTHKFVSDEQIAYWNSKVNASEIIEATVSNNGLMTKDMVVKLNSIIDNANNYVHPETHPATMIIQDSLHEFVTDAEKAYWNGKASTDVVAWDSDDISTHCPGLMPPEAMIKLNKIEDNANNYVHPETHSASMIITDSTHRFVTDEEKAYWNDKMASKLNNVTNDAQVKRTEMGVANGVATLNDSGLVPAAQLPSYVDEIIEYNSKDSLPEAGKSSKIYICKDTKKIYRWSGSQYVEIPTSLALGETSSTAYAGDKGKANAEAIANIINGTTTVLNAATVNNLTVETAVPANAVFTDTVYTHPASHPASMIIQDETRKFVTETEKAAWNAATNIASSTVNGLMTTSMVNKLNNIASGANKYVHPDTHPATMIMEDAKHRFITDEERAAWNAKGPNVLATSTINGLMSATDKSSLQELLIRVSRIEDYLQRTLSYVAKATNNNE